MDICNPKNRIGYYAPQSGTGSGGTGTWTITSTETSTVTQNTKYIDAVDVQANHGSFTTLTLNGVDFSSSLTDVVSKTQFMSATTTPSSNTTFSSVLTAPSLVLSGGVFTVTTANITTGNITTGNFTDVNSTGTLTIAKPPILSYTSLIPSFATNEIGWNSTNYTFTGGSALTATYVSLTADQALPIGVYLINVNVRFSISGSTTNPSVPNTIYTQILNSTTTTELASGYKSVDSLPANATAYAYNTNISYSFLFAQNSSTSQNIIVRARLAAASVYSTVSVVASTASSKICYIQFLRVA